MAGFTRGPAAAAEESQPSRKSKHSFPDKSKLSKFYIRLVPALPDYEPDRINYHVEAGTVPVAGAADAPWKPRTVCLGRSCPRCVKNRELFGPKERDQPYNLRSQSGQFFMAYVVTLGGDGSVDFGENPVPLLFEYKYRWTKVKDDVGGERFVLAAEDWLNLMDAFEAAQAAGVADPSDAEGGAVFEVDFRRVPVPNSDKKKDVFVHRHVPLAGPVGLPSDWRKTVTDRYPLTNLYLNLSHEDLKTLVDASTAYEALTHDFSAAAGEVEGEVSAIHRALKSIKNADFKRILDGMEKKAAGDPDDIRPAASEVKAQYAKTSNSTPKAQSTVVKSQPIAPKPQPTAAKVAEVTSGHAETKAAERPAAANMTKTTDKERTSETSRDAAKSVAPSPLGAQDRLAQLRASRVKAAGGS